MHKKDILARIEDARKAHFTWLNRIERLIENVFVSDELIELDPKESEFGDWLYEDIGKCKSSLFFLESLQLIEKEHLKLHEIYFQIYRIYFIECKRNPLTALFLGERKNLTPEQEIEAISNYNQLLDASNKLMKQLNTLERKIRISNDNALEKCLAA